MPSTRLPLTLDGRLAYAQICMDRFVEVYKARLGLWTFFALGMITLAGFGVQYNKPIFIYLGALIPFGLLLIDIFIKRHYASPFLYIAMKIEHEELGAESAVVLFAGSNLVKRKLFEAAFRVEDEAERQAHFRSAYVWSGIGRKAGACLAADSGFLLIALQYA